MVDVGFLLATAPNDWSSYVSWFRAKLRTLNRNARVNVYPTNGAGGDANAVLQAATHLANNSDVIVTAGTLGALACKQATQANQRPFVFASVGDARISGLTHHHKQAQLASLDPQDDIGEFISDLQRQRIKSLYVCSDLWITVHSTVLNIEAHAAGMKTMWEIEEQKLIHRADDAYGVSFQSMFEMAAEYVDKILRGTQPGNLTLYEPPLSAPASRTKKKKSQASRTKKRPASVTKKKSRRGR